MQKTRIHTRLRHTAARRLVWLAGPLALAFSAVGYSNPDEVWDRQVYSDPNDPQYYSKQRQVWDPSLGAYHYFDIEEVYQFDSAPYRLWTDRAEMWFPNYRCMHSAVDSRVGWHQPKSTNTSDWLYSSDPQEPSWCQLVDFNPYLQSAGYYDTENRWWNMATAATWGATQIWNGGSPANIALVRFTENKTMYGNDGVLRRGAPGNPDLTYWGYANWKMDGTPTQASNTSPSDDTEDGFYMGFVTLSLLAQNPNNNWGANALADDHGPIVWPKRGYRQWRGDLGAPTGQGPAWQQTSQGVRHPTAFRWGNQLYVYYLSNAGIGPGPDGDKDPDTEGGIFVARAEISNGTVGPFKCGADFFASCLPAGYSMASRAAWENSLSLPGPQVLPILSSHDYKGITSFSVSAIENTNPQKFVGVAEQYDRERSEGYVRLFTSTDRVHWTYHSQVYNWSGPWGSQYTLHYPKAIRAADGDSTWVNAAQFYIVGAEQIENVCLSWQCKLNRITVTNFY